MKQVAKVVGCLIAVLCGTRVFGFGAFSMNVKSVSSSGYYNGASGVALPDAAFDGNVGSYWLADTPFNSKIEYFLAVELQCCVRPNSYTITEKGIAAARRPKAFKLYAAADGANDWIELDSRTGVVWGSTEDLKTFEIDQSKMPDGVYYRSFKLQLIEPSGSSTYAFAIAEFEMDCTDGFDPDGYAVLDIVETARTSGAEIPFEVTSTGELDGAGHCEQLFDGDLTVDSNKVFSENGRALFVIGSNPATVTISFDSEAFGNRPVFLRKYGFRMGITGAGSSWSVPNRLPAKWTVAVSDKESPADDDWVILATQTMDRAYSSINDCYTADYVVDSFVPARHVRFEFMKAMTAKDYVQLGEICLYGISPSRQDQRGVDILETAPAEVQDDGSALTSVLIVQRGLTIDPYDLLSVCRTGERVVTNWLECGTCFTGRYAARLSGLRLDSDYELRIGVKSSDGDISWGSSLQFRTHKDRMSGDGLPAAYAKLEYLESTDGGCQYVDCGFSLNNTVFGFDFDFIGYNAFVTGNTQWQGNRDTDYGVYLVSSMKGADPAVIISSSTGGTGKYSSGLFFYNGGVHAGNLTRNERTRITLSENKYVTACGATTNTQSITRAPITGPNLMVFANGAGAGYEPGQFAVMRFYSLKTYDDGVSPRVLTHDFVPARRLENDTYGLFDLIDNRWCPAGGDAALLAGPQLSPGTLTLGPLRYFGWRISAEISREGAGETDVYAAWGADYGGIDVDAWQNTAKCGVFAAGGTTAKFTTPKFGNDTVYVRFYTGDGLWSETIYLPDQRMVKSGTVMIVR